MSARDSFRVESARDATLTCARSPLSHELPLPEAAVRDFLARQESLLAARGCGENERRGDFAPERHMSASRREIL